MTDALLVLNVGSSSIKFALYDPTSGEPRLLLDGKIGPLGHEPSLRVHEAHGEMRAEKVLAADSDPEAAIDALLDWLRDEAEEFNLLGVGHRVVHAGEQCEPVLIDDALLAAIERHTPAAPYHNPHNLTGIRTLRQRQPDLPQVACFDTHFHRTQPEVATRFALPREITEQGLRRFGFHGLSYEYIAGELPRRDPAAAAGRALVAHLGNGASMCAMRAGKSIATSMGYTALDGLVMGRRCGALDPGVVLHLIRQLGHSPEEVEAMLYRDSGLLGVSGISNDMRELLAGDAPSAEAAIELYCHRAIREAGGLIALLQGVDALVFTGGVGEHAAPVRARIVEGLAWLGIQLDVAANRVHELRISAPESSIRVWVIPTDEARVIARHSARLLASADSL